MQYHRPQSCDYGFTIHAEKCPNRRGVEKVLASFAGNEGVLGWTDLLAKLESDGSIRGVWLAGGYKTDWNSQDDVEKFSQVKTLVVHDCFASPLWNAATIQLPGATFAERAGSYVNFQDRLQSFTWAVRPPPGVKSEGQLLWSLLGKPGMYQARQALEALAHGNAFFAPALTGVGELGIDLRVNMLAGA